MTGREKRETMLKLVEDYLTDDSPFTCAEILHGVQFARGRGDAPTWWAEVVFEKRGARREDREESAA